MNNYSIKARLFILTGLGLLMTTTIIVIGMYSSHHLKSNLLRLTQRNIPLTESASEIRGSVLNNWINTLYLTRINNPEMAAEIEADMKKNSDRISQEFDKLKSGVEGNDEKALLEQTLQKRKDYTASRKRFIELTQQGNQDEINTFLMHTLQPQLHDYLGSLSALSDQRRADVEETAKLTETTVYNSRIAFLTLGIMGLVGGIFLSLVIVNSITRPLNWAISLAGQIAKGNLKNDVRIQDGEDEVTRLVNALAAMQTQLREILGVIQSNSEELAQSSQEFSASAADVTTRSQSQSEATSTIAASVEEMTQSIYQIAEHAEQTRDIVGNSEKLSQRNNQAIDQTMTEMQEISSAVSVFATQLNQLDGQSQQISAILNVIREVADQTNLLALNAAIEAARAGEQGRGFAVVADEVRKLAERTTQATQEISDTITAIQLSTAQTVQSIDGAVMRVDSGVDYARNASDFASKLHHGAEEANQVVSGISDAIREQSRASEQIAQTIGRIAEMTEHNTVTVTQMSAGANKLKQLAEALEQATHRFNM